MARLTSKLFLCIFVWMTTNASWSPQRYEHALRWLQHRLPSKHTLQGGREGSHRNGDTSMRPLAAFPCSPQANSSVPTSVHRLRPSDINVVAAMGDSITAGNGINASNAVDVLNQLRGRAWSIGGDKSIDEDFNTLANVLKKFNPQVKGFSTGYGDENSPTAWMNVAVSGALAATLSAQADHLIQKLKTDTRVDWQNDWKVITILIGGDNLCDYCLDHHVHSPEVVGGNIRDALDKLHAVVPRALINLVPMTDVTPIVTIKTGLECDALHWYLCTCAMNPLTRGELKGVQMGYYQQMASLVSSKRYDTRDDFTVVLQPFLVNQDFIRDPTTGKYDPSYIAPDCFHPNWKMHADLAKMLWNTMITPVQDKVLSTPNDEVLNMTYKCPTEKAPYIFTNANSQ